MHVNMPSGFLWFSLKCRGVLLEVAGLVVLLHAFLQRLSSICT